MIEQTRTCPICGREFTTTHPCRLYCLGCSPPGRRVSHCKPRFTPGQLKWFEKRSRENMAWFFIDELFRIKEGRRVPRNTVYVLKQNDLVVSSHRIRGVPYVLTALGEEALKEVRI